MVDEERIVDVELHDARLSLQFLNLGEKHDSLALRRCLRLEDVNRFPLLCELSVVAHELPEFRGN